jgi:DNA-binding transcriptional regulator YiaG
MGGKMINVALTQAINPFERNWGPCTGTNLEIPLESYKSTNASFYVVLKPLSIIESSGQTFGSNRPEGLLFSKTVTNEKKNEIISTTPVEHLKGTLGINISETADILQLTRQAIYDWKSGKAIPSVKNQERINKLVIICKKWESLNLGPIRHLIRQNIWDEYSLFDLLCKEELDEDLIYTYFDKIKAYISALNKEREHAKKIKEQHGFKRISDDDLFEKIKKNSRKIG